MPGIAVSLTTLLDISIAHFIWGFPWYLPGTGTGTGTGHYQPDSYLSFRPARFFSAGCGFSHSSVAQPSSLCASRSFIAFTAARTKNMLERRSLSIPLISILDKRLPNRNLPVRSQRKPASLPNIEKSSIPRLVEFRSPHVHVKSFCGRFICPGKPVPNCAFVVFTNNGLEKRTTAITHMDFGKPAARSALIFIFLTPDLQERAV